MTQLGFFLNLARCTGCHTCEIACKEQNGLGAGPRWRRVRTVEGGTYPHPFAYFVSMACNHCADPACVRICPVAAYAKRADGLVIHDPERCIGCRSCTFACPYGAPQYDEAAGRTGKCSGCYTLVDQGQEPACVAACPMRALEFGPLDQLRAAHPGSVDRLPVLPDPSLTHPSVLVAPRAASGAAAYHRWAPCARDRRRKGRSAIVTEWPLAIYTLLVQTAAGMMVAAALQLYFGPFSSTIWAVPPVLLVAGLLCSFFHLGRPARAAGALRNLRTSWISREILLTLLVTAVSGGGFLLYRHAPGSALPLLLFTPLGALLGLCLVYATGMVYQIPGHPIWHHWSNVSQGFATALLLGPLTGAALGGNRTVAAWLVLAAVVLLLVGQSAHAVHLGRRLPGTAITVLSGPWQGLRRLLSVIIPGLIAFPTAMGAEPGRLWFWIALCAAVLGESIGRIRFYQTGIDQLPQF